jgi:hypothetical protein
MKTFMLKTGSTLKQIIFLLFLAVVCMTFKTDAQTTVVTVLHVVTPPPFPPTIPSLEPDDSSVNYNYETTGSGW